MLVFLLHFSPFRCMLQDRKLQPLQVHPPWNSGYGVRTVRTLLIESQLRGSNPVRAINFFTIFLKFFIQVFWTLYKHLKLINWTLCRAVTAVKHHS